MSIPETMSAVQLHGHGGPEQLILADDVPTPRPDPGEVLIDVHACGMNNTDIWVREGAYGCDTGPGAVSSWRRGRPTLTFPRIQGADIVVRIAAVGPDVERTRSWRPSAAPRSPPSRCSTAPGSPRARTCWSPEPTAVSAPRCCSSRGCAARSRTRLPAPAARRLCGRSAPRGWCCAPRRTSSAPWRARSTGGRVNPRGEPAYVAERDLRIEVPGWGPVRFDLVYSGAHYAMIEAADLDVALTAEEQIALTAFGDAFVRAARPGLRQEHPSLGDVGPLPFVHFMGPVRTLEDGTVESRSATYVHPGVICRSPTGTGTSARLALLAARGEAGPGFTLETISPRGNRFRGELLAGTHVGGFPAWDTSTTGSARLMARSRLTMDLDDPLVEGEGLEGVLAVPGPLDGQAADGPRRASR